MTNYSTLFEYPAQPADEQRIREIEHGLGRLLPDDYTRLLSQTGGGFLSMNTCYLPEIELPDGDVIDVAVDSIFGNGKTSNNSNVDLLEQAAFLMEEWEIPDEVLLLATTSDGMHQCFVINYRIAEFPLGSVLHFNTDPEGQMTQVADSVDDFLSKLGPNPYAEPDRADVPDNAGIIGVRQGQLSPALREAISQTPTPGIEQLLRKSAEPLALTPSVSISKNSVETRRFLDVLYWIAQHVAPQSDPQTFVYPENEENPVSLHKLISESFVNPDLNWLSTYSYFPISAWWETRVEEGLLRSSKSGYVLDSNYIDTVLDELRAIETATNS